MTNCRCQKPQVVNHGIEVRDTTRSLAMFSEPLRNTRCFANIPVCESIHERALGKKVTIPLKRSVAAPPAVAAQVRTVWKLPMPTVPVRRQWLNVPIQLVHHANPPGDLICLGGAWQDGNEPAEEEVGSRCGCNRSISLANSGQFEVLDGRFHVKGMEMCVVW